ncbi:hypothetical protein D3C76_518880 [compost metagenome]
MADDILSEIHDISDLRDEVQRLAAGIETYHLLVSSWMKTQGLNPHFDRSVGNFTDGLELLCNSFRLQRLRVDAFLLHELNRQVEG